jgi:drug/metabolite transporter (DMT)-like permease
MAVKVSKHTEAYNKPEKNATIPSSRYKRPPLQFKGELCALLSPLAWAISVILFKQATVLPPAAMNLFKNTLALVLLSLTMGVVGVEIPVDRPAADWSIVALSGLLGLSLADTLLFTGLSRIGASRLAVVDTTYAPTVIVLSALFLNEPLSLIFLLGAAGVLGGVALASIEPQKKLDRSVVVGMLYAWGGISCTATAVVLVKPVLEQSELLEITWSRLFFGVGGQLFYLLLSDQLQGTLRALVPSPAYKTLVPASILGTWLSLLLWLGGFKWAPASVAAVLNQLATVYILVLARVVLKEELKSRQIVGTMLAAVGALVLVLYG